MPGPLNGIRIIDLSVALTGPLAVGMLCDQGADVIRIERPGFGDQARFIGTKMGGHSAMTQVANRGKRAIVVNTADDRGRAILFQLIKDADVLVENYRPGVTERLGISYDRLREINPELIYVSITGFGPDGPYTSRPVYDTVIQAQSGLADNQRGANDDSPAFLRQLVSDKVTAYTACQAITAALLARERGAGGQLVELNMLDANIAFLFVDGAGHEVVLDGDHSGPTSATATNTPLRLADGFAAVTPVTDEQFHGLCTSFDVDSSDPRLTTIMDRFANPEVMSNAMRTVRVNATSVPLATARARMDTNGVPYGVVVETADVPFDDQVIHNKTFVEHDHPAMGRIRQTRPPVTFHATPAEIRELSAATLGQHTDEVLTELGHADSIAQWRAEGVIQ